MIMSAESRGRRVLIATDATGDDVRLGAESLVAHLTLPRPGGQRRHDLEIDTIDGAAATKSSHAAVFQALGFRRSGLALRKALDYTG
jgi:hypothetical protein